LRFVGFARDQLSRHDMDVVFLTGDSARLISGQQGDHKRRVVG